MRAAAPDPAVILLGFMEREGVTGGERQWEGKNGSNWFSAGNTHVRGPESRVFAF